MPRITFTADDEHEMFLDEVEQRDDIDSTAAAVRHCIEVAEEAQQRDAELQKRVEELQQENERLQNEKHTLINDRQEKQELVEYVQEEQSYREAPLKKRLAWWVWGKDE